MCIDFLNQNSGAITLIFTMVVALATVAYVVLTWSLVSETKKLREVQTEPKISAIIQPREEWLNFIDLIIQNIGLGPAYNIQFQVDPDFEEEGRSFKLSDIGFIKNGLRYLAPNQKLQTYLTNLADNFEQKCNNPFRIVVSYQSAIGKRYNDEYLIDFSQRREIRDVGKPAINKIADSIERIETHVEKYLSQDEERIRNLIELRIPFDIRQLYSSDKKKSIRRESDISENETEE